MKSIWLLLAMLTPTVLHADLALVMRDHSHFIVYRDGEQVYAEHCPDEALARGCSGFRAGHHYSTERDAYVRSVQSFYGLTERYYGGLKGSAKLDADLAALQRQLDQNLLNDAELNGAEEALRALSQRRDQSERAQREILQYLENGNDTVIDENYQWQRSQIISASFRSLVYVAERKRAYYITQAVAFERRSSACGSKFWSLVRDSSELDGPVFKALQQSTRVTLGQPFLVWAGGTEGYYLQHWFSPLGDNKPPDKLTIQQYELLKLLDEPVKYYSLEYVPGKGDVVDLGVFDPDERLRTEATNEPGAPGTMLPAVCKFYFDFSENKPAPYLNGEHFATFSLYDLEPSLERMAKSVYVNRADFFRQVAKVLAKYPLRETDDLKLGYRNAGARLFVLLAIEPLLHDIQSRFVDNYVLPDYNRSKEQWSKRLGAATLGEIDLSPATYQVALELLRGALQASAPYLSAEGRKAVEALVPVMGRALATGQTSLADVNAALGKNRALLEQLTAARRAHGFGVMATAIADYLEHKSPR